METLRKSYVLFIEYPGDEGPLATLSLGHPHNAASRPKTSTSQLASLRLSCSTLKVMKSTFGKSNLSEKPQSYSGCESYRTHVQSYYNITLNHML